MLDKSNFQYFLEVLEIIVKENGVSVNVNCGCVSIV